MIVVAFRCAGKGRLIHFLGDAEAIKIKTALLPAIAIASRSGGRVVSVVMGTIRRRCFPAHDAMPGDVAHVTTVTPSTQRA